MLHLKQRLEYTINRIGFSKLTILYRKIIETTVFKHILFCLQVFRTISAFENEERQEKTYCCSFCYCYSSSHRKKSINNKNSKEQGE